MCSVVVNKGAAWGPNSGNQAIPRWSYLVDGVALGAPAASYSQHYGRVELLLAETIVI